jgi:hypothetical protein
VHDQYTVTRCGAREQCTCYNWELIAEGVQCNYDDDDTVWDPTVLEFERATHRASTWVMRGVPALKMAVLN